MQIESTIPLQTDSFLLYWVLEVITVGSRIKRFTCSKAAVFSDIHANYYALKACYEDAVLHGVDCFIFLGDYISDLADPTKTLDLVYNIQSKYPTICLCGNRERYMLDCAKGISTFSQGSKTGSLLYTFDQLRPQDFDFIAKLPIYDMIEINGIPFEIAHSIKDNDRFYFEKADMQIQSVFAQMKYKHLLTGHSHKQYNQSYQGKTIINPGSIGIPQGGARWPQYALLEIQNGSVDCRLHQVPYNLKSVIHAQFESGLVDYAKYWAISILYDVITGKEYTMQLLDRVYQCADGDESVIQSEKLWHNTANEMGMRFTEAEIFDFLATAHPSF